MTNKIALRTVEEFMADYVPTYSPLYSLFLGRSKQHSENVGKADFKRLDTVGDIRAKHITPKDSELRQIASREASKTFKKYFLANQYRESELQDRQGLEDVTAQVLDEHQKQADDLFLLGEGTSESTMINNGLFWSSDPNYRLESSVEVAKATDSTHILDLHAKVMGKAQIANQVAGRKLVIFYGATMMPKYNGLYLSSPTPFKGVLQQALGSNYSVIDMPEAVVPAGSPNGFMIVNMDKVMLHYTALPQLKDQGVNSEFMYAWFNFMLGSMMLEVEVDDAIIRQPTTFAA